MRKIQIGTEKYTQVWASDERDVKNCANHQYEVHTNNDGLTQTELQVVRFQKGPIKESGVNGVMNEDLIVMVIDRLESFQQSKYNCRENAIAITKLEECLMWLRKRTEGREKKGIEGTHEV